MTNCIASDLDWEFSWDSVDLPSGTSNGFQDSEIVMRTEEGKEERKDDAFDVSALYHHLLLNVATKMPNTTRANIRTTNSSFSALLVSKDNFLKRAALKSNVLFFVDIRSPNTVTMTTLDEGARWSFEAKENHVEAIRGFAIDELAFDVYEECPAHGDVFPNLLEILRESDIVCNRLSFTGIPVNFAIEMMKHVKCFGDIRFMGRFENTINYIKTLLQEENRSSFYVDLEEMYPHRHQPVFRNFWQFAGFTRKEVFNVNAVMEFIWNLCNTNEKMPLENAQFHMENPVVPPFDSTYDLPKHFILWNNPSPNNPDSLFVPDMVRIFSSSAQWIVAIQFSSSPYDGIGITFDSYDVAIYVINKDMGALLKVLGSERLPVQADSGARELLDNGSDENMLNNLRRALLASSNNALKSYFDFF